MYLRPIQMLDYLLNVLWHKLWVVSIEYSLTWVVSIECFAKKVVNKFKIHIMLNECNNEIKCWLTRMTGCLSGGFSGCFTKILPSSVTPKKRELSSSTMLYMTWALGVWEKNNTWSEKKPFQLGGGGEIDIHRYQLIDEVWIQTYFDFLIENNLRKSWLY